jgi:hypothetical protein
MQFAAVLFTFVLHELMALANRLEQYNLVSHITITIGPFTRHKKNTRSDRDHIHIGSPLPK